MRIVLLDGYTLNPGDLSWDGLLGVGDCTIYDRTADEEIIPRSKDAVALLTNKTPITRTTIEALPALRYIGVLATGFNIVDAEAARERGIPVTNVPSYGTESVAEMVFAHLLNLALHVGHHASTVREGRWSRSKDFAYWDFPLTEIAGSTMGILGFGRIGRSTARIAKAFGLRVIATDPDERAMRDAEVEAVGIDDLFRRADILSLHCPLTPATRGIVSRERLATMKPTAWLINTSRGLLVDEEALADALERGALAGAGLDVLSVEPPAEDNPLLHAPNCYITPHTAWATKAARARLMAEVIENLRAFKAGTRRNVVNL